jgi:hypothetical protein
LNRPGITRALLSHLVSSTCFYSCFNELTYLDDKKNHSRAEIRVAAVWSAINITHRPIEQRRKPGFSRTFSTLWSYPRSLTRVYCAQIGMTEFALSLRSLGFERKLREMREDVSLDVRERVVDALANFDPGPVLGVDR